MQIKDEGTEKNPNPERVQHLEQLASSHRGGIVSGRDLNDTGLSSTFKSIDLPPKEYEQ